MRKSNWDWVAAFLFFVPCLSSFGVVFICLFDWYPPGRGSSWSRWPWSPGSRRSARPTPLGPLRSWVVGKLQITNIILGPWWTSNCKKNLNRFCLPRSYLPLQSIQMFSPLASMAAGLCKCWTRECGHSSKGNPSSASTWGSPHFTGLGFQPQMLFSLKKMHGFT